MPSITVRPLILTAFIVFSTGIMAETTQDFNSSKGVPIQRIKSNLQNSCWSFHYFDVNSDGWNPDLEGDGAMVSTTGASTGSSISTPVLQVTDHLSVSFDYTFDNNFKASPDKWLKLCLATADNEIVQVLETINFDGVNATLKKKYSTEFQHLPEGAYRLVLQYGSNGTAARIAIDALRISAPYKYPGGCNTAPVAVRDHITGLANRSASGSLLKNDKDVNHETLTAYLIKGSKNGKVELGDNGSFIFTPNDNFRGDFTSFTYKICDNGPVNLCSENTTVLIRFPEAPRSALNLSDFRGFYRHNGIVELAWKIQAAQEGQKFEVERSGDGQAWESSGTIAVDAAVNAKAYSFIDRLSRNRVQKNDLYYRLRQINADGSSVTSRLLIVRVYNTKTLTMISVTPNPSKNDVAVNVQLQEDAYVSMRVLDNSGNLVMRKLINAVRGISNFMLEGTSRLTPGPYSLEVIVNSKERMVVKLIKE